MATGTAADMDTSSIGVSGLIQDGVHGGGVHPTIHIIPIIHTVRHQLSSRSSLQSKLSRHRKKRIRLTGFLPGCQELPSYVKRCPGGWLQVIPPSAPVDESE